MATTNIEDKIRRIIADGKPGSITYEGKKKYINKNKIKEISDIEKTLKEDNDRKGIKEGGFLPLLTLLPLIFGGLGAAGTVAGGVATAVKSAKEGQLADAQRKAIEGNGLFLHPYTGTGLYLQPYEGKGIMDFLKTILLKSGIEEEGKKSLKNVLKNLSEGIEIRQEGSGLYLEPYNPNKHYK